MNTLLAKLSFKNEEERDFTRETRAKIIHHTRPDSQEMLKGILKTVMKGGKLVTWKPKERKCMVELCTNQIQKSTSLVAQRLKRLPPIRETRVRSLGREDPLEKEMEIHSSILAWRIPWIEKPSRLQSTGSQRVGHDWATSPYLTSPYQYWDMVELIT